jgi:hypothetical protein
MPPSVGISMARRSRTCWHIVRNTWGIASAVQPDDVTKLRGRLQKKGRRLADGLEVDIDLIP